MLKIKITPSEQSHNLHRKVINGITILSTPFPVICFEIERWHPDKTGYEFYEDTMQQIIEELSKEEIEIKQIRVSIRSCIVEHFEGIEASIPLEKNTKFVGRIGTDYTKLKLLIK